MLGVDVGTDAAVALSFCNSVHGQCGLTRGFWAVDFDNTATWQAADSEGDVERDGPGADGLDAEGGLFSHTHDGTLTELLVDLGESGIEGLVAVVAHMEPFGKPVKREMYWAERVFTSYCVHNLDTGCHMAIANNNTVVTNRRSVKHLRKIL